MSSDDRSVAVATMAAASGPPHISRLNVSHNSSMHIGPQFVSVTQNVHQDRVVKGRVLGLEVEARGGSSTRRLRCSVAVFVCWALVTAAAVAVFVTRQLLRPHPTRLDLNLTDPWYLRRVDWYALPAFDITFRQSPADYAIVGHSAGLACTDRYACMRRALEMQTEHQRFGWDDIGPNYLVGGGKDGVVLEGRGANVVGAMVKSWNTPSVLIMFLGDYRRGHDEPSPEALAHLRVLLKTLVDAGALNSRYVLLGHCQVKPRTIPPGVQLLRELQRFPHFDYRNITTCQEWRQTDNISSTEAADTAHIAKGVCRVAWAWIQDTTRGERLVCAAALTALLLCVTAAAVLTVPRAAPPKPDIMLWNITREMWLAAPRGEETPFPERFLPLRLVVVQHTAGPECSRTADCTAVMRNLQGWYFKEYGYDVPYNYVIGNDGRVYEGRGSRYIGAHTSHYNWCALGLGFTGNYGDLPGGSTVTKEQTERTNMLLSALVEQGVMQKDALILGARDLQSTESPGERLYKELRSWPTAPSDPHHFRNRTCDDIYDELRSLDKNKKSD